MKLMKRIWVFALILTIGLSACANLTQNNPLEGTSWRLVSYGGIAPLPDTKPTLEFETIQVGGNASCNSFGGQYGVRGDTVIFEGLTMTLMACLAPEGIMEQENAYMQMLGGEMQFEITDGQLILTNQQGEILVFEQTGSEN